MQNTTEDNRRGKSLCPPDGQEEMTPEAVCHKLRDVENHKVELEKQKKIVCETRQQLDALRSRYLDLFDLARFGY
jgi:hypothetical protein